MTNLQDTKKALADLANLPRFSSYAEPEAIANAKRFMSQYGKLRRPKITTPEEMDYVRDVIDVADWMRRAWKATAEQSESEMHLVGLYLDSIFDTDPWTTWKGSAIRADFAAGKWEPVPRNFLDELALQLMRSCNMLHRCENPDCQKYIVKEYSHDKYCSIKCSEIMRKTKVKLWRKNRQMAAQKKRRTK